MCESGERISLTSYGNPTLYKVHPQNFWILSNILSVDENIQWNEVFPSCLILELNTENLLIYFKDPDPRIIYDTLKKKKINVSIVEEYSWVFREEYKGRYF